jgi:hypothetical protein
VAARDRSPDLATGSGSTPATGPAGVPSLPPGFAPADERRHDDAPVEAWWWWGSDDERRIGVFVGFEVRGRRFDYWAGLVREGLPYLYIEELDGTGLRAGLEIKPPQMWADHVCDVPFAQWSLGNEAHGVLLDDPTEAWRRAHGDPVPVTFDVEWYGSDRPHPLELVPDAAGYRQAGEVDVQIELLEGVLSFTGAGERVHVWGAPYVPRSFAMPSDQRGLRAPYRRSDGRTVDQVLTDRWWVSA